jgi:hypothetical protein
MTPSTISQPLNNVALSAQTGGEVVAQTNFNVHGGDALIGVSASAYSSAAGMMTMEIWLDGQPTGSQLQMYANVGEMHMSLGHSWVWCEGLAPGQHELVLIAGETTVTDQNDVACATVWEMGDGCTVRFSDDAPCPTGTGQPLMKEAFETKAGQVMISASTSGWVTQGQGSFVGSALSLDSGDAIELEVCANNLNQHLATVPTDLIATPPARGQHRVVLSSAGNTSTDGGDTAHLTIVEWTNPTDAPNVLLHLQNDQAQSQQGNGGSIISAPFQSGGRDLLVRVSASVWTQTASSSYPLYVGIQIDGTSAGFAQIWANFAETHMAAVTNDLVVVGVGPGQHTLNLMGEAGVITDYNDRVSVTIMEFPDRP